MSASHAFLQLLGGAPAESPGALAAAVLALLLVAAQLVWVVPGRPPRAAALLSVALAAVLLGASAALLMLGGVWWPVWPALLALGFGHLGIRAGRARTSARMALPQRSAAPTAPSKAAAAPSQ